MDACSGSLMQQVGWASPTVIAMVGDAHPTTNTQKVFNTFAFFALFAASKIRLHLIFNNLHARYQLLRLTISIICGASSSAISAISPP